MKKYNHRPMTVDAQQFKGGVTDASSILNWINTNGGKGVWCGAMAPHSNSDGRIKHPGLPETLRIRTHNGWEQIHIGDYVVRTDTGIFSPCDAVTFDRDYESALADVIDISPKEVAKKEIYG